MTSQGPLGSGDFFDAGSFGSLLERAASHTGQDLDAVRKVRVVVAAASGHASYLIAASREFDVEQEDGRRLYTPTSVLTKQERASWRRRKLRRLLAENLSNEGDLKPSRSPLTALRQERRR
jgi:uncharacterized protein (DUF1778 family)